MVLTTYGRSSGFCIDPIEKKPLAHFLPGTPVLSFGTAGCNLTCGFCQNWDISKSREMDRLMDAADPEAIADTALREGCRSVAFTYNDPVIFLEYAVDTAKACRERGLHPVAVTAGYIQPEARNEFFRHMDAANVDLKAFTSRFYRERCGAELEPVLDTLRHIRHETDCWLEITTLLIPGENDSDPELRKLCSWILQELGPDVPLHFTAFHPDYRMRNHNPTPESTLLRARQAGMETGLHHVYTGNIPNQDANSTTCSGCGLRLIGRYAYQLTDWHLDTSGCCTRCGTPLPGRFDPQPGNWGSRRKPVRMQASG
jgi:pyruvate formate lyase activating enzyme